MFRNIMTVLRYWFNPWRYNELDISDIVFGSVYTNEHIFKNSAYYEKKHNVSRSEFIKIYNLFVSLSFITIKNSLQKSEAG